MADQDQLTPEEIAEVKAMLKQRGFDANLPVQARDRLPSENELGNGRLTWLGRIKRRVVFAWAVGSTILAILTLPKDCLDVQEFYVPKCRAVVGQVAQIIHNLSLDRPSAVPTYPADHRDHYYAYNPGWQAMTDQELLSQANSGVPIRKKDNAIPFQFTTVIGSTGNTNEPIISQSGIVRGLG